MKAVEILALLAALSVFFVHVHANGGSLAPCRANSDCAGGRTCRALNLNFDIVTLFNDVEVAELEEAVTGDCDEADDYCVCAPQQAGAFVPCDDDDSCLDSERCYAPTQLCFSKDQIDAFEVIREDELRAICPFPLKCPDNRQCVKLMSRVGFCLAEFSPSDSSSEEGAANEGASDNADAPADDADDDDDDDDDDDSSAICIGAKSLAHLHPNDLMYPKHFSARVLCDSFESCATPGHMVRYHGQAMMMKSYCELVGGCTRTVMHVNSPRYRRALQIPSDTPHLSFTAFAARYASRLEEHALRTAVRMGL